MSLRRMVAPLAQLAFVRRKFLFEADLDRIESTRPAINVRYRMGGEADLRRFNYEVHGYDRAAREFGLERLAAGDRLIVGDAPSGVAFYAWLMFGQMDLGLRAYRRIPVHSAYTYKLFTVASYRGLRICPAYYAWLKDALASSGTALGGLPYEVRRVISWVEAGNGASIRVHERSGFHRIGSICHVQLLFRNYFCIAGHFLSSQANPGVSAIKCGY